ncbi:hypothetical protein PINS_up022819 [Pythium insidiosum]|nr:hypothetical protein PINS_up022819 [Pythium insidiosum]
MDYEPSSDAIEWRMKYEDLEESFMEVQDRLQALRSRHPDDDLHIPGEVEKLNIMLLGLTKQLAHVIRDKHRLVARLSSDEPSFKNVVVQL